MNISDLEFSSDDISRIIYLIRCFQKVHISVDY